MKVYNQYLNIWEILLVNFSGWDSLIVQVFKYLGKYG